MTQEDIEVILGIIEESQEDREVIPEMIEESQEGNERTGVLKEIPEDFFSSILMVFLYSWYFYTHGGFSTHGGE